MFGLSISGEIKLKQELKNDVTTKQKNKIVVLIIYHLQEPSLLEQRSNSIELFPVINTVLHHHHNDLNN
jgi:hypothetical protein